MIWQAGGVFVDRAARQMLEDKLITSRYNTEDFLSRLVDGFEKKVRELGTFPISLVQQGIIVSNFRDLYSQTKRIFDGTHESSVIQFGFSSDNDRPHDIIKGKMSLNKAEVAITFDNVITRIVDSCLKLLRGQKVKVRRYPYAT